MAQASQLGVAKIIHFGSDQQKRMWLPRVADGSCLPTIAVTEPVFAPAGTSDIQSLRLAEAALGDSKGQWSRRLSTVVSLRRTHPPISPADRIPPGAASSDRHRGRRGPEGFRHQRPARTRAVLRPEPPPVSGWSEVASAVRQPAHARRSRDPRRVTKVRSARRERAWVAWRRCATPGVRSSSARVRVLPQPLEDVDPPDAGRTGDRPASTSYRGAWRRSVALVRLSAVAAVAIAAKATSLSVSGGTTSSRT